MKLLAALLAGSMLMPMSVAAQPSPSKPSLKAAGTGKYFLVLGDSESTGFHYYGVTSTAGSWHCEVPALIASGRLGWACKLLGDLGALHRGIKVENLAVNGEDSCSFIAIQLCPGSPISPSSRGGPPPYNIGKTPQLQFALKFLRSHQNQVSPIIFLIGGNDLPATYPSSVAQSIYTRMASNRDSILSQTQGLAPPSDVILPDYADPSSNDLKPDGFITVLDKMIAGEAVKYGAFPVDLAHPTEYWHYSFSDTQNNHPSDTGQRQIAELLWAAYRDFLHERKPVPLMVRPTSDHIPSGHVQSLAFSTVPQARVSLKLSFKGGTKSWSAHADGTGHWKVSWSTKGHSGKVLVKACASKGGSVYCVDEYFIVT